MDIDLREAKETFIQESCELLQEMENALLSLEAAPHDQGLINSLFRSAHTIKGSSGVLGIGHVERFTHVVENLLSKVREGEIKIIRDIIEVLLECRDHISSLVELAADDAPGLPDSVCKKDAELIERLNVHLGQILHESGLDKVVEEAGGGRDEEGTKALTDAWHISLRFNQNVLREGMDPISFINYLSKMGEIISLTTLCNVPASEEMDAESCYTGFEIDFKSEFDKKSIEDVFEFVREDSSIAILPPNSRIDSYIELIQNSQEGGTLLGEILVKGGALTQTELDNALELQKANANGGKPGSERMAFIGEILVNEGMVSPEVVDAALERQKKAVGQKAREASTIRIDSNKLDNLINLVGELVISSANIGQHAQHLKNGGLAEAASVMLRLVEEVRETTMKIRMVPIGETFGRFNRVVRDIGKDCGKEIELIVSGGDTELDKNVVEKINDPLMHLVRNAADHGLERPDARVASGKTAKGTVRLNAYHDAGSIVIEVEDDGKGLNREKICEKAVVQGLAAPGQTLTDNEIFRLIFEPGFSTAEQVTKLSGRGVGMDVVKRNIESLRGTVDVESTEGRGTKVRIRLPLTLAIIDGFMVGVSGSNYVIPLDMVVECVELSAADRQAANKRNYINLRGEILPYIRLRDYFNEQGAASRFESIVIVQYAGQKVGLVVDELFGEVQTVIKSLGKAYKEVKGVSGATIMGNGRVALIIDVPRLIQSIGRITAVAV
ncbi:MAG: chemotaxis protein CheA [Deltaproteobacteria bacterium]